MVQDATHVVPSIPMRHPGCWRARGPRSGARGAPPHPPRDDDELLVLLVCVQRSPFKTSPKIFGLFLNFRDEERSIEHYPGVAAA